jgi:hypothetical protein
MEHQFIVVDEYGDSLRAFPDKESAEVFVKLRPGCCIERIPELSQEEFTDIYGEPPF